jgi:hypothetical protein
VDVESQWRDYEEIGEEQVRKNLASNVYGEDRTKSSRAWLAHKAAVREAASQRTSAASQDEANSIARVASAAASRAAAAAERSATAAERANKRAAIAIAVSIASVIVTIIFAILGLLSVHSP